MREADFYTINQIGIPSMVLMERAALQVVECMEQEQLDLSSVLILCGAGNNGGDGYAVARLLHLKGFHVEIGFLGKEESRSEENRLQRKIADYYEIHMFDLLTDKEEVEHIRHREYSVIIDAIFGTGLKRDITGVYAEVIQLANLKGGTKVAIDIPSGVHDTTGQIMGNAFRADLTVAIAFIKRGLVLYPGAECAGVIRVGEIGITEDAVRITDQNESLALAYEWEDLKSLYPKRTPNSHKGTYGKVLMIVGSTGMSGAAYLSASAAYAVGAGLVQIYTSEDNRVILQQLLPEAIITTYDIYDENQLSELLAWADVVCIGCGLGKSETAVKIVQQTLKETKVPCVVDADALNILSEHMEWIAQAGENLILTPHMKEMSRLLGCSVSDLTARRETYLKEFCDRYLAVCVLKDARTWIVKRDRVLYINLSGNAAMAKAGSGDVLAGMIAGIVSQKTELYEAVSMGVYLHGLAGDAAKDEKGSYSVLARDIIFGISKVLESI